jgi:very-short-patch-repair endonuclease
VHRRADLGPVTTCQGIPVTTPAATIVDLAGRLPEGRVERMVNEADKRGHVDPDRLLREVRAMGSRRGAARVRALLERHTFTMTDSELEQLLLPVAAAAGLPPLKTQVRVNGFRVDFYSAELGMVIETDGLTYHRTPMQQSQDRYRDQVHRAAGIEPLRFTRWQVKYDRPHVQRTLAAVAARLRERSA